MGKEGPEDPEDQPDGSDVLSPLLAGTDTLL